MSKEVLDFGSGYTGRWIGWSPDREIPENAERYKDVPDIEKCLLQIACPHSNKKEYPNDYNGGIHPDTPEVRAAFPTGPHWTVVSWEPLTLTPSILMQTCGCHGYITEGKWVSA